MSTNIGINDLIKQYMENFEKIYGKNHLKWNRSRKIFQTGSPVLQFIEKDVSDNIEVYNKKDRLKTLSTILINNLKPIYSDLVDINKQENVLYRSLSEIGKIVREKLAQNNQQLKEELIQDMATEGTLTDPEKEAIADEIIQLIFDSFETDLHKIYANIKIQFMADVIPKQHAVDQGDTTNPPDPDMVKYLQRDEYLDDLINGPNGVAKAYQLLGEELKKLDNMVFVQPVISENIDDIIESVITSDVESPLIDVFAMIMDEQVGGAITGNNVMNADEYSFGNIGYTELDGAQVPVGVKIFTKSHQTPDQIVNKFMLAINKSGNLRKKYILKTTDSDFKKVTEHVLYRCHEIDMLTVVEVFKFFYFTSNAILLKKINSNMYGAITKIYHTLELHINREEEFLLPLDIIRNVMNYIGTQSVITKQNTDLMTEVKKMDDIVGDFTKVGRNPENEAKRDTSGKIHYQKTQDDGSPVKSKGLKLSQSAGAPGDPPARPAPPPPPPPTLSPYNSTPSSPLAGAAAGPAPSAPPPPPPPPPVDSDEDYEQFPDTAKSRLITGIEEGRLIHNPETAKALNNATTKSVDAFTAINKELLDKYYKEGKHLFANPNVDNKVLDEAAKLFTKDEAEIKRLTDGFRIVPNRNNNTSFVDQSGGADKLFNISKGDINWQTVDGDEAAQKIKELFFRCYIIQIMFSIEFEKAMVAGGMVLIEFIRLFKLNEIYIIILTLLHVITSDDDDFQIPPHVLESITDVVQANHYAKKLNDIVKEYDNGFDLNNMNDTLVNTYNRAKQTIPSDSVLGIQSNMIPVALSSVQTTPISINITLTPETSRKFKTKFQSVINAFEAVQTTDTPRKREKAVNEYRIFIEKLTADSTSPFDIITETPDVKDYDNIKTIVDNITAVLATIPDRQAGGVKISYRKRSKRKQRAGGGPNNNEPDPDASSAYNNNNDDGELPPIPPMEHEETLAPILTVRPISINGKPALSLSLMTYAKYADPITTEGIKNKFLGTDKLDVSIDSPATLDKTDRHSPSEWIQATQKHMQEKIEDEKLSQQQREEAERARAEAVKEAERLQKEAEERQERERREAKRVALAKKIADEEALAEQKRKQDAILAEQRRQAAEEAEQKAKERMRTVIERMAIDEEIKKWNRVGIFQGMETYSNINGNSSSKDLFKRFVTLKSKCYEFYHKADNVSSVGDNINKVVNSLYEYINTVHNIFTPKNIEKPYEHLDYYRKLFNNHTHTELSLYFIAHHSISTYFCFMCQSFKGNESKQDPMALLKQLENITPLRKLKNNVKDYDSKLYEIISETNEDILGQARVIVALREGVKNQVGAGTEEHPAKISLNESLIALGESYMPIAKANPNEKCVTVTKTCGDKVAGFTTSENCFGVFHNVFENTDSKTIFDTEFAGKGGDNLIDKTILNNGNLIVFGFGFSGSGKTFLLLDKANENNILSETIKYVKTKNPNIKGIKVSFEELYPVKKDKDGNFNVYNYPGKEYNSVKEFTDNFNNLFNEITKQRISNLRIAPTPNNDESSRSHMFIVVEFKFTDGSSGKMTLIDMAGSENTIEIKQQFLVIDGITDGAKTITYNYSNSDELYNNYTKSTINTKNSKALKDLIGMTDIGYLENLLNSLKSFKNNNTSLTTKIRTIFPNPKSVAASSPRNLYASLINLVGIEINFTFAQLDMKYKNTEGPKTVNIIRPENYHKIISHFINKMKPALYNKPNYNDKSVFTKQLCVDLLNSLDLSYLIDVNVIMENIGKFPLKDSYFIDTLNPDMSQYITPIITDKQKAPHIGNPFMVIFLTVEYLLSQKLDKRPVKFHMLLYHTILVKIILAYVNLIVKQGKGIVTTLEHLKYLFLYRTGGHIGLINYNETHKSDPNKQFNDKLATESQTYTIKKQIKGKDVSETVEMGRMKQSKMIELLCKYSCEEPIDWGSPKLSEELVDGKKIVKMPANQNAKFLMFAAILRGNIVNKSKEPNGKDIQIDQESMSKYCSALIDTLVFAESITSGIGDCIQCCMGGICDRHPGKPARPDRPPTSVTNPGNNLPALPPGTEMAGPAPTNAYGGFMKKKNRKTKRRGHRSGLRSRRKL